jgi:alkaline phosphatase D
MKKFLIIIYWSLAATVAVQAQLYDPNRKFSGVQYDLPFDPALKPFYHGVASGDPLHDRVIIWTRVTPDTEGSVMVSWQVCTDTGLTNRVKGGYIATSAETDYTVKIDVDGLSPSTTYYYNFSALGKNSITGRTKTTPAPGSNPEHLRFSFVSCSNYQHGYFNAYGRIAERNDLDAVIHLGDYIYEYDTSVFSAIELRGLRSHIPPKEILDLSDYRIRYSLYRLDPNLRAVHQQHPFLAVWDDHESANDAYKDGAQNHTPGVEGFWKDRKEFAKQAYFEWMPIRNTPGRTVYRKVSYGNFADIILLDTRLEGRMPQATGPDDPELLDTSRTILGKPQYDWFTNLLKTSTAKWKVVGNQVVFAQTFIPPLLATAAPIKLTDSWEGYPYERKRIIEFIKNNNINNVILLTGDIHSTFAGDISLDPGDPTLYNSATGAGSYLVEFVTPSITSANFDELAGASLAGLAANLLKSANPHIKNIDLVRHGYSLLTLKGDTAQADWFYVDKILEPSKNQSWDAGRYTTNGANHLKTAAAPAPLKAVQDLPAPGTINTVVNTEKVLDTKNTSLAIITVFPNPNMHQNTIHYSTSVAGKTVLAVFDAGGKKIATLVDEMQQPGNYYYKYDTGTLDSGTYYFRLSQGETAVSRAFQVVK